MAYRAVFDPKREFGIELEGFGVSRSEIQVALTEKNIATHISDKFYKDVPKWTITVDGTVNQDSSLEIISPILKGKTGLFQIKKVCDALNELEIKTDESCGLHIHWSATDFTGRHMINLLRLYGKYEKVLDFIFQPSRRQDYNQFAHTLLREGSMNWLYKLQGGFYFHAYQIAKSFETTQPTDNKSSQPTARHHKVNICAYNKYHTIEFRQHEGTFDFEKIKNWIIFSQQLINRAKDTQVYDGVATWESLMKTLALAESQLKQSLESPDKVYLREARDYYRKIYRENKKEGENEHAIYLGSGV